MKMLAFGNLAVNFEQIAFIRFQSNAGGKLAFIHFVGEGKPLLLRDSEAEQMMTFFSTYAPKPSWGAGSAGVVELE